MPVITSQLQTAKKGTMNDILATACYPTLSCQITVFIISKLELYFSVKCDTDARSLVSFVSLLMAVVLGFCVILIPGLKNFPVLTMRCETSFRSLLKTFHDYLFLFSISLLSLIFP